MFKKAAVLFLLIPILAYSQAPTLRIERFSIDKGLSQNAVTSIAQDTKGFLWIGTEDGLNRFDGYNFYVFKKELKNPNSISDNFTNIIYEDKDKTLWIGTSGAGLNRYDATTKEFIKFNHSESKKASLSSDIVTSIFEDSKNNLWIGTTNGLDILDRKSGRFKHFTSDPNNPKTLPNQGILSIFEDKSSNLWIGTQNGLAMIKVNEIEQGTFKRFYHDNNNPKTLSNNTILSLIQDRSGMLWIGTKNGLNRYNPSTNEFKSYYSDTKNNNSISDNTISALCEDKDGLIWIATYDGLTIYNSNKMQFYRYYSNPVDNQTLNDNLVQSLYQDNSGVMWVGTKFGGLAKFRKTKKFEYYLKGETVGPIVQSRFDLPNIVWVGTARNGLKKIDRNTNTVLADFKANSPDSRLRMPDNTINALMEDKDGNLWAGTWNGGLVNIRFKKLNNNEIGYKDRVVEQIVNYSMDDTNPFAIHDNTIQSILEDDKGRLWIGHTHGIDFFNREENKFYLFTHNPANQNTLSHNSVQGAFIQDRKGNYWVGTWDGLNKISINNNDEKISYSNMTVTRFMHDAKDSTTLSDNKVISIWEDNNGIIWVGTYGGGINKIIPDNDNKGINDKYRFRSYTDLEGLPNNSVYGINDDGKDNIWISTNNGLACFTPSTEIFRNYETTDGLQSNQFFWRSSSKNYKGELLFGGINGLNIFIPDSIKDSKILPKIAITSFKIFDHEVGLGKNSPLTKQIWETTEIELNPKEKVFSFEFTGLHFYDPLKNQYAYKMEGFDEKWNSATPLRRFASYTNLDPGTYTFKVKASNSDGYWNEVGTSIKVTILPPWYSTWWFRLFSIIIIGGAAYYIVRKRTEQLKETQRVLEQKIHEATNEATIRNAKLEEAKVKLAKIMQDVKEQLGKTSEELLDATNSQATSIEEISASMEQMTKEINDNAEGASKIFTNAKSIEKDAKLSVVISTKTVSSIKDITNEIYYIGEFARLTKFLSLNASIEAAHAGEHGKTFSVIAQQTRKLAEQSKTVAIKIKKVSESGLKLSLESSEKVTELQEVIKNIVGLIAAISESSTNQSSEASHINTAIQQLATYVNNTSQMAEKLDAAIQSLTLEDDLDTEKAAD